MRQINFNCIKMSFQFKSAFIHSKVIKLFAFAIINKEKMSKSSILILFTSFYEDYFLKFKCGLLKTKIYVNFLKNTT